MSKDNKTSQGHLDFIISSFDALALSNSMHIIENIDIEEDVTDNDFFEVDKECFYFYIHVLIRLSRKFWSSAHAEVIQDKAFPIFVQKVKELRTTMHLDIESDFDEKLDDFAIERDILYAKSSAIMSEKAVAEGGDVINTCIDLLCKNLHLGKTKMIARMKLLAILGDSLNGLKKIDIENHIKRIVEEIRS